MWTYYDATLEQIVYLVTGLWSRSRWSRMFSAGVGVGFLKLLESGVGVGFLKLLESESESVFQNCWSRSQESEHLLQLPTPMFIK